MPTPTPEIVREVPRLAPRDPDANKGDFGRVLVVAGSRGMSGAAVLCASAALRGGAGLVRVAVPEGVLPIVAAGNPCYMTVPLPQDDDGRLQRRRRAGTCRSDEAKHRRRRRPWLGARRRRLRRCARGARKDDVAARP